MYRIEQNRLNKNKNSLKILQINLEEFQHYGYENSQMVVDKTIELIHEYNADIICIQECRFIFELPGYTSTNCIYEEYLRTERQPRGGYNNLIVTYVKNKYRIIKTECIDLGTIRYYEEQFDVNREITNKGLLTDILADDTVYSIVNVYLSGGRFEDARCDLTRRIEELNKIQEAIITNREDYHDGNPEDNTIIIGDFNSPLIDKKMFNSISNYIYNYYNTLDTNDCDYPKYREYLYNVNKWMIENGWEDIFELCDDGYLIPMTTTNRGPNYVIDRFLIKNTSNILSIRSNIIDLPQSDHNGLLIEVTKNTKKCLEPIDEINHYNILGDKPVNFKLTPKYMREYFKPLNIPVDIIQLWKVQIIKWMSITRSKLGGSSQGDSVYDKSFINDLLQYIYDITTIWKPEMFLQERLPITISHINIPKLKQLWKVAINDFFIPQDDLRKQLNMYEFGTIQGVLNMPIKMPNSDIIIPPELQLINKLIIMITSFELAIKSLILENNLLLFQSLKMRYSDITPENFISAGNKLFDDYWMYLTIDSGEIEPGKTQRNSGVHIDGIQGSRYKKKFLNDHCFIIADSIPTKFFNFKFDVPKDEFGNPDYDINWYEKSKGSLRDDMTTLSKKHDHKTYDEGIFMSGLQLHEADMNTKPYPIKRTFFRLEFVQKAYDRIGDTINPILGSFDNPTDRSIKNTVKDGEASEGADVGSR